MGEKAPTLSTLRKRHRAVHSCTLPGGVIPLLARSASSRGCALFRARNTIPRSSPKSILVTLQEIQASGVPILGPSTGPAPPPGCRYSRRGRQPGNRASLTRVTANAGLSALQRALLSVDYILILIERAMGTPVAVLPRYCPGVEPTAETPMYSMCAYRAVSRAT